MTVVFEHAMDIVFAVASTIRAASRGWWPRLPDKDRHQASSRYLGEELAGDGPR
jgi:hypothetical protein